MFLCRSTIREIYEQMGGRSEIENLFIELDKHLKGFYPSSRIALNRMRGSHKAKKELKTLKKKNSLQPKHISDILFRIDEYLNAMRTSLQTTADLAVMLDACIEDFFKSKNIDELTFKKIAVDMVDEMYVRICNFTIRDSYTDTYFEVIVKKLFLEFAAKNIFLFYVLDNQLRDDRFKSVVELFSGCEFSTIFPYSIKKLHYRNSYTKHPVKKFLTVENQIRESISAGKHIFYVEKDDSINYLDRVVSLAEENQRKYECIFRNQGPDVDEVMLFYGDSLSNSLKDSKK